MAKLETSNDYDINELLNVWSENAINGQTFMIVGPVGIGKTQWINEISKMVEEKTGIKTIVKIMHPARSSNTDYVIPIITKTDEVEKKVTKELRDLVKTTDEDGKPIRIIAAFDEWDRAEGPTRNALLSFLNEGIFEDMILPKTTSIILLGNQNFSRDTNELNQAEKTRMPIYIINPNNLTKTSKYLRYWMQIAQEKLKIDSRIISFIATHPNYLSMEENGSVAFASPRSWEILSKMLPSLEGKSDDTVLFTYQSCVGLEAGSQFKMYVDYILKMPSAKDILSGKAIFEELEKQYASLHVLSAYIENEKTLTETLKFIKNNYGDELLYLFILMNFNSDKIKGYYKKLIHNNSNIDLIKTIAKISSGMSLV